MNDIRQRKMDCAIADFFTSCSTVPPYIVEGKAFRNMLLVANPQWNEIGRQKLRSLAEVELMRWKTKVKLLLMANKGFICAETDLWSDRRLRAYMSIFGRLVTPAFELKRVLIAFGQVHGSHSGANIRTNYDQFLEDAGISTVDIARTTTDNARNMIKCFQLNLDGSQQKEIDHILSVVLETNDDKEELLKLDDSDEEDDDEDGGEQYLQCMENLTDLLPCLEGKRLLCFAHSLQLVVIDSLKTLKGELCNAIAKANNMASASHQCQAVMAVVGNLPTPIKTR